MGMTAIEPLLVPPPMQTLVMEKEGGQLFTFDGFVPLPIGSRIEITNRDIPAGRSIPKVPLDPERFPGGAANAVVTGLRVWGTQAQSPCLVLDVELTLPGELLVG
jgi:hypothetical protein